MEGEKEVLAYELFQTESPENYKETLENLKKRGLNKVLLFIKRNKKRIRGSISKSEIPNMLDAYNKKRAIKSKSY